MSGESVVARAATGRPTEAIVDVGAVAHNVATVREWAGDSALCAVVKADGYGHGAAAVAGAALDAGAAWLAVATGDEVLDLVDSGLAADVPILVLSDLAEDHIGDVVAGARGVRLTVGSGAAAKAVVAAAASAGGSSPVHVHLKVDTGMHRMGVSVDEVVAVARELHGAPGVRLEGIWTHLAVADEPDDEFTAEQLARFAAARRAVAAAGIEPGLAHAANSAGLLAHPDSHHDMVRAGIAVYGVGPSPDLDGGGQLVPALRLVSRVSAVRTVAAGEGVSYGRIWRAATPTRVATVPIGYADGISRASAVRGVEVLVRGRRRPMLGVVTMDQLMIGVDDDVAVGDEVVLIGSQGDDAIDAWEIARRLDTIAYEVLTMLGPRVPRRVVGDR